MTTTAHMDTRPSIPNLARKPRWDRYTAAAAFTGRHVEVTLKEWDGESTIRGEVLAVAIPNAGIADQLVIRQDGQSIVRSWSLSSIKRIKTVTP